MLRRTASLALLAAWLGLGLGACVFGFRGEASVDRSLASLCEGSYAAEGEPGSSEITCRDDVQIEASK